MVYALLAAIVAAVWLLMTTNKVTSISGYARTAGFAGGDLIIAVAIALAESSGDPNAIGDKTLAPDNGPSYGLWQINMGQKAHAAEFAGQNLFDPQVNANAAFQIYKNAGMTFRPWATFTQNNPKTGQPYYISHLDAANADVEV